MNDTEPVGSHALIVRFMKGVARTRPALPRYHCIWDVNVVLDMFRLQPLVEFLSLYDLTLRTVTLLALVQTCQPQFTCLSNKKINLSVTNADLSVTFLGCRNTNYLHTQIKKIPQK